jgi:nucleoside transporter
MESCCSTKPKSPVIPLSIMMFIQFFIWGSWFTTLGPCLDSNSLGDIKNDGYGSAPLAAIIAPLFLGLIADRFFPTQIIMAVLFLIGGGAMLAVPSLAADAANNKGLIANLFLLHMLCYMPTLGLGNTIAFSNIKNQQDFPKLRVWGTIGWIAAGLTVGFMGWSTSLNMFYLAGVSSIVLGLFCFTLPHTPPPAKGQPINARAIFMLDAFALLKKPAFAVFAICSTLICIPLAYYYGIAGSYLTDSGFKQAASSMTIGQMSEIFFMLLIPFFFRKLGVKWMILIGMLAWVLRYVLFAFGAPEQVTWMLFLGIALHGICYDFFFVTGFIYTDKTADKAIRGQAQALLVFLTQGVGMFIGFKVAFGVYGAEHTKQVTEHGNFARAMAQATPESKPLGTIDSFKQMFSVELPKFDPSNTALVENLPKLDKEIAETSVAIATAKTKLLLATGDDKAKLEKAVEDDSAKLAGLTKVHNVVTQAIAGKPDAWISLHKETSAQWKAFWIIPAIMAAIIAAIFFLGFWYKDEPESAEQAKADANKDPEVLH